MKSIMHDKEDKTCYLCMMLHSDYSRKTVQEHHVIFGSGRRKLSEKYGLKVYLCLWHHIEGKEAVHRNAEMANILKAEAQIVFEKKYPEESFLRVFGKNYLDLIKNAERQQVYQTGEMAQGIKFIDDPLGEIDWE